MRPLIEFEYKICVFRLGLGRPDVVLTMVGQIQRLTLRTKTGHHHSHHPLQHTRI